MEKTSVRQRVNITLPKETIRLIDYVTEKGDRSRFLDEAALFYVQEIGRANLRKSLREGAVQRASRDISVAQEWFSIERGI